MKKNTKRIIYLILVSVIGMVSSVESVFSQSSGIMIPDVGLPDPPGGIQQIIEGVLIWLLSIIGIIAIISFIISGFQYFMAAGDEKEMEVAKRNLKYSILGVIVALSGFVVIQAIDAALWGDPIF